MRARRTADSLHSWKVLGVRGVVQGRAAIRTSDVDASAKPDQALSGLPAMFLLVDGGMKLFKPAVVVEATVQLGYPESYGAASG